MLDFRFFESPSIAIKIVREGGEPDWTLSFRTFGVLLLALGVFALFSSQALPQPLKTIALDAGAGVGGAGAVLFLLSRKPQTKKLGRKARQKHSRS